MSDENQNINYVNFHTFLNSSNMDVTPYSSAQSYFKIFSTLTTDSEAESKVKNEELDEKIDSSRNSSQSEYQYISTFLSKRENEITRDDRTSNSTKKIPLDKKYIKYFSENYFEIMRTDEFEFGMGSNTEVFVRKELKERRLQALNALNQLYLSNHSNIPVILSILKIISHINYEEIQPLGPTIAIASFSHKSDEVKECSIRAFENWEAPISLDTLKSFEVQSKWLKNYLDEVIAYLEYVVNGTVDSKG